ncbi:MAG: ATP-grasp domain-containing protein [Thermoanaerobaculia bacterium]|nr:ATP-grasp domain-containing protein [Thermoanaerobaculia bacterium]
MRYVIMDPIGTYASRIMEFLGGLELEAIGVFTSQRNVHAWEARWSRELGHLTSDVYLATEHDDLEELAARVEHDWPGGFAGIIPWDEMSILRGAQLGELLELGWNPVRVIERCRDKHVMKAWLRRTGKVRINASRVVRNAEEALGFQAELGRWPIVVKPSADAGAHFVSFAGNPGELLRGCQQVRENGRGDVLLEEYIAGDEFAVNGIVDKDGDLLVTDVWYYDKRASHGIANLYYQSIKVGSSEEIFWLLARYAAAVVEALELRRSPLHMEVKVDDDGPCLIELGARFAGGDQPVLASKLHGRSLFELAACHYLADLPVTAMDVHYERYDSLEARIISGIQTVEIPRVQAVLGLEEVQELPSFDSIGVLRRPGMPAPQTRDLDTKAYEVYLVHPDPRQVARDAHEVRRLLRYV